MRLRRIGPKERKRERLGAAVAYELILDTMGGAIGRTTASVYLGPSQVTALWDAIDADALRERESMEEILWGDLMAAVERIKALDPPESPEDELDWAEYRGQARGLAFAIAVLRNPYAPSVDEVRDESVVRWEEAERAAGGPAAS